MKKFVPLFMVIFFILSLFYFEKLIAQTPQKLTYQAVIRNSNNTLLTDKQIGIQISILKDSVSGAVVYSETRNIVTNAFGLINIEIGGGLGFSSIGWGNSIYFIKTEMDLLGGVNYTITGVSQLLCVPFAFQSKTTEGVATLTQLQVDALTPYEGIIVYNSTSKELIFYDGTIWKKILN